MYTYIVVDDEQLTQQGVLKKLESYSGDISCVGTAENGESGLKLIMETHPDIIITDMNMPGMDGGIFLLKIREILPDIPIIVISGYKDFEYAHRAIESNACKYILKPFPREALHNAMDIAIARIEESDSRNKSIQKMNEEHESIRLEYDVQNLRSTILGYIPDMDHFHSSRIQSLTTGERLYSLFTLRFEKALNLDRIIAFIIENDMEDFCICVPNICNSNVGALLFSFNRSFSNNVSEYLIHIAKSFLQTMEQDEANLIIGMGDLRSTRANLKLAYEDACSSIDNMVLNDTRKIFPYQPMDYNAANVIWDREAEFMFRVENSETDVIPPMIAELFDQCVSVPTLRLGDMKAYCIHLFREAYQMLKNYISINSTMESNTSIHILNNIFSFDELQNYITIFFNNICNLLKDESRFRSSDVIQNIKIYTQEKYYNNLSLDFIASLFYMNPSYISHLFKKSTGTSYNQYLTDIRLNKARELLSSTDRKTAQIAKQVGYDNEKYFYRLFKKHLGLTPEEYRHTSES